MPPPPELANQAILNLQIKLVHARRMLILQAESSLTLSAEGGTQMLTNSPLRRFCRESLVLDHDTIFQELQAS